MTDFGVQYIRGKEGRYGGSKGESLGGGDKSLRDKGYYDLVKNLHSCYYI